LVNPAICRTHCIRIGRPVGTMSGHAFFIQERAVEFIDIWNVVAACTTQIYARRAEEVTLYEVERILA